MAQSLEGLILSLLECSSEKDGTLIEALCSSLRSLGARQHGLLLRTMHAYLARQSKMLGSQRALLLSTMDSICCDVLEQMDDDLAILLVNMATQEMSMAKDTDDEWQANASSLLVTLSRRFCAAVMDSLLQKFQPGCTARISVLQTMGSVSVTNVFGFVPFLSDVIGRTIPMLGTVKNDQLKVAFTFAIRRYCESVCEYVSNIDEAPDPTVTTEIYATQFGAFYDTMISWLNSKDMKLRSAVVPCLGEMCHIIPREKLHEELKRLISSMLSLYKKTSVDNYAVSQGLCRLLEGAAGDETCPVEPYLEEIWVALFPQVCEEVDYSSPNDAKNQNEVLRCFHVTAAINADRLVYYLVQKMQSGQEKYKLGALSVMRHLINSSGPFLADKRSLVIRGLQPVLQEANTYKVKKSLCHLSVALADHTYLEAEGGRTVIEFLVRNLTWNDDNNVKKTVSEADMNSSSNLRTQCAQALLTIARTCEQASNLLWPYLFEFICVESYSSVVTDLCRCLSFIANRTLEYGNDLVVESDSVLENPRLPGREQVLARLFVLLGGPVNDQNKRCIEVLKLMQALASWLNPAFVELWAVELPSLLSQLQEGKGAASDGRSWERAVLRLLISTVVAVHDDGEWRSSVAAAFGKQFHLYNNYPDEKKFLCRCLGGIFTKIVDAQFVLDHLELMFKAVDHSNGVERLGCAQAVGYCSSVHTDIVLNKLENIAKWEHQKKSGGIFGFLKDSIRNDVEMTNLRATIMLCYGYLVYYCSVDIVTQRLENTVLRFLKKYFQSCKDVVVKECLLQTVLLIAVSVHPSHLGADYVFQERSQLITYIKDYVQSEPVECVSNNVRLIAANATSQLAKLDPPLPETELWTICTVLAQAIYPLNSCSKSMVTQPFMERQTSVQSCIDALDELLQTALLKQPTAGSLTSLLKLLQQWFDSPQDQERERTFHSALLLLKSYYGNTNDCVLGKASDFSIVGNAFARFCPRFCDSLLSVRLTSLNCAYWVMCLNALHKGLGKDFDDPALIGIEEMSAELNTSDLQTHLRVVNRLAEVIEQKLPPKQIQTYLSVLFELVLDKQTGVSCAAAVLLQNMLTVRGPQLHNESEKIVSTILSKLPDMQSVQTYAEALQALHAFSSHHLSLVLNSLLTQPLPFSQAVVDCWHSLSRGQLLPGVLGQLVIQLEAVDECPSDNLEGSNVKYARPAAVALTSALIEVLKGGEPEDVLHREFPRLLSSILIHCSSLVDTQFPFTSSQISPELRKTVETPAALVHTALKTLLLRIRTDSVIHHLNEEHIWNDFEHPQHYASAMGHLGRAIANLQPEWVRPLVELLEPKMESPQDPHRIVACAVIASFVKKYPDAQGSPDPTLLSILVHRLVQGLADTNIVVRKLSVRGLGDLAHADASQLELYTPTALSAIMAGLEDPGDHREEVALEAMQGLNKLSARIARTHMDNILVSVLLRIKPCFDKDSGALRAVAFSLFAELASFGDCDAYKEQIHSNIVPLLLHLNDEEPEVQKACARVFVAIDRLLECQEAGDLIRKQIGESGVVQNYRTFAKEFSKILTRVFSDRVNFYALCCSNYFKSGSSRIRANAALLTGYLLGGAPADLRSTISKELVFAGLSLLLKEPDVSVKLCVAEAISGLYDY